MLYESPANAVTEINNNAKLNKKTFLIICTFPLTYQFIGIEVFLMGFSLSLLSYLKAVRRFGRQIRP